MPTIPVRDSQCLLDIAMQECGDATASYAIALANGWSVTDDLATGQQVQTTEIVNARVKEEFDPDYLKPASAYIDEDLQTGGGIGYWQIEKDFVVS